MNMPAVTLTRRSHEPRPALSLGGDVMLATGRAHELTGPARRSLAAVLAAGGTGPVFWIHPRHPRQDLMPEALRALGLDPGRITFVTADRVDDLLWTLEEVLRSGLAPLAIAELAAPPGLTPVRRLHLAAEAGATAAPMPPSGLLLTPTGNAQGVETRWHCAPAPGWADPGQDDPDTDPAEKAGPATWILTRRRARMAPPASWRLRLGPNGPDLAPVPLQGPS